MSSRARPLVLIHGFTGSAEVWRDVESALGNSCTCIAIDLPGHGRKSGITDPSMFSFDRVTQSIAVELSESQVERFDLWGYSLGGRVALHFALTYPNRVNRLILEGASAGLPDPNERAARQRTDEELAQRIESGGLDEFVDIWMDQPIFSSQKSLPVERQALGRRLRLLGSARGYAAVLRGLGTGRMEPLHNRLRELTMPVLVMAGELDSKYRAIGEAMARSIPNAQFRIIPDAGHAPHWERPAETAATVAEFISVTS